MAGKSNLKSLADRPPEEARRIQSQGGKKSAEVRRAKKKFREQAEMVLNLRPRALKKVMREWSEMGYDVEAEGAPTLQEQMAMRLARRALEDDDNAFVLLMSYSHNPTMAEKLEADKIKAIAAGRGKVDVNVKRDDVPPELVEGLRRMVEDERYDSGAADSLRVSDEKAGEVRADAGIYPADGAAQPLDP